jgi:hypothetical protein
MPPAQVMRPLILILLIGTVGQCYAGTFALDTIDNWQIYHGTELVLAGHDSPLGTEFQGTIKATEFKELTIHFNHCVRYTDGFDVKIEIVDESGKNMLTKKFKVGSKMTIDKKDFKQLMTKSFTIRYQEKRENGTNRILGRIRLV